MNLERLKQSKLTEEQMKARFIEHMDHFYRKKEQDRQHFRQKYLKLNNPERAAYGDTSHRQLTV